MPSIYQQAWDILEPVLGTRDSLNEGVSPVDYNAAEHLAVREIIGYSMVGASICEQPEDIKCRQCQLLGELITDRVCSMVRSQANEHERLLEAQMQ